MKKVILSVALALEKGVLARAGWVTHEIYAADAIIFNQGDRNALSSVVTVPADYADHGVSAGITIIARMVSGL